MKIIFTTIPMKDKIEKLKYPVEGYKDLEYEHPVIFPVNAVLAKTLQYRGSSRHPCRHILSQTVNVSLLGANSLLLRTTDVRVRADSHYHIKTC